MPLRLMLSLQPGGNYKFKVNNENSRQSLSVCSKLTIKKVVNTTRIEFPAGIYLLKVNNRNTRKRCEICSKLTVKLTVKK